MENSYLLKSNEGYGCKKCKMPYSRQEVRIYSELKLLFNDTKSLFKI